MLAPHETLLQKIVHYASRITVYNTLVGNQSINMQNCFFYFLGAEMCEENITLSRLAAPGSLRMVFKQDSAANYHVIMAICTVQIRPQQ